jgi:hypothetical protein
MRNSDWILLLKCMLIGRIWMPGDNTHDYMIAFNAYILKSSMYGRHHNLSNVSLILPYHCPNGSQDGSCLGDDDLKTRLNHGMMALQREVEREALQQSLVFWIHGCYCVMSFFLSRWIERRKVEISKFSCTMHHHINSLTAISVLVGEKLVLYGRHVIVW